MKKTVKFFSFVLLVTMLFSLMASSASAIVSDDTAGVNGGGIVIGGGGNVSVNSGGGLVIGGDQRPEDDSPFTGVRVDESGKTYNQRINSARAANLTAAEQFEQEAVAKYMKQAEGDYSGITDSENSLIQANQDFLMYVRDHIDSVDEATLQTAVNLFGDDVVYGTRAEVDEEAVESRKEEIQERQEEIKPTIESLSAQLDAIEQRYREELGEDTDAFLDDAEYVEISNQFNALADESSNLDTEDEVLDRVLDGSVGLMAAPTSETQITSTFSQVCPGYSSLASAVSGSNYNKVLTFTGKSFDICNSTDYRITVDLHAATIDARACPAAFTIRQGVYGGTVTFTNGTIVGDGFYVTSGGVLNLGGLVNGNYVDITVFAENNAVYVDAGGTAVIGQGTTLVGGIPGDDPTSWYYKQDATKYMRCSTEPVVYIAEGGTVKMTGGLVEACSIDGTNGSVNNYAIEVADGRLEISSSVAEVKSRNINSPAIYGHDGAQIDIHNGYIYGPEGIAVEGGATRLSINGGQITGFATYRENRHQTGAAVEVLGTTYTASATAGVTNDGTSPIVFINGGTLRSERSAGVVNLIDATTRIDPANRPFIKRIAVDDVNVTIQETNDSDYAKSRYLVTGNNGAGIITSGYATLDEAITAANSLTGAVTIQLIDPKGETITTVPTAIVPNANATSYIIDGNGYGIKGLSIGGAIITVSGANAPVTIKNIVLSNSGDHAGNDGIDITDGTVHIGPNVTVEHFENGLHVEGGVVTVNGLNIEAHNDVGILAEAGQTTVHFVKNDSATPVDGSSLGGTDFLRIDGGWFAYKEAVDDPTDPFKKVATYVDPDFSYVKFVEKDNYYEVLYNDTPNVEIDTTITKRYGNEKQPNGTNIPYIVYDKSNPDPLVFKEVAPALVQIDAVPIMTQDDKVIQVPNKIIYPIFTAENGKTGTIRIPDRAVLEDLPAGRYDLRFTFKNGYVMEDKLRLYVFPKYAGLFAVPNGLVEGDPTSQIISPNNADVLIDATDMTQYTAMEYFNGEIVKYLNDNFDLIKTKTAYPIGAFNWNVAVVTSELPDKVTIGNAADNTNSILLENYIYEGGTGYVGMTGPGVEDRTTWGVVPSGPYKDYYFYIISYADLNNLSAGQNWVFLNWNGFDGALKNLPLTIKNDYVSISPTKVDWSKIDNYVNFTVNPAPQAVYVDGELVPSGYWTYDASTKTLSIKGTYFAPLESKDHTLEVVTGLGKASATVKTGMGLKANGIDYHVYGGNRVVNFQASDRINQDAGIWIGSSNPTKLDPSAYTWNGTNGFTLNPAFLNRLALGTYYISAYVYNGNNGYNYTTTTFRVISATQASNNPATGDNSNITLWLVILALSATAIVVIVVPQFRKSKSMH